MPQQDAKIRGRGKKNLISEGQSGHRIMADAEKIHKKLFVLLDAGDGAKSSSTQKADILSRTQNKIGPSEKIPVPKMTDEKLPEISKPKKT